MNWMPEDRMIFSNAIVDFELAASELSASLEAAARPMPRVAMAFKNSRRLVQRVGILSEALIGLAARAAGRPALQFSRSDQPEWDPATARFRLASGFRRS